MLCAEFHCRPSEAIQELQRAPVGFIDEVILTRRYVEAYFANQGDPASAGSSPMRTLAQEIEMEFAQEAHDRATVAAEAKANGHHD